MTIDNILSAVLPELGITYYDGAPEFPENEYPQEYCYYTLYSIPAERGDGEICVTEYTVTLTIGAVNASRADALAKAAERLFENNGFLSTGCRYNRSNDFPRGNLNSIDFKYYISEEETT